MKRYEWVFYRAYIVLGKRYSIPEQIKEKIEAASPDELYIVAAKANTQGFVINRNKVSAYVVPTFNESNILAAANIIKRYIAVL